MGGESAYMVGFSPPGRFDGTYGTDKDENTDCFASSMPIRRVNSYHEAFPWDGSRSGDGTLQNITVEGREEGLERMGV